jgi:hypothetical protein
MSKKYETATALRTALETRLRLIEGKENIGIPRLRKQVVFDRLLARIFRSEKSPWYLKGGYAMQLRIRNSRATKDVDLAMKELKLESGDESERGTALRELLQEEAAHDLGDFFQFLISGPILDLDSPPYGGARFLVEAKLDKRVFEKFHLDVGIGDAWLEPLDSLQSREWITGFGNPIYPVISKEQHFAEKLHAYTVPRPEGRENSRVKDLVDLALLSGATIDATLLKRAIEATFDRRGTHAFDPILPPPPTSWLKNYRLLAQECGIDDDIQVGFSQVQTFLNSVFS